MKDLQFIISELSKYTKRAYFVGGYVRDNLLGIDSKDVDIEVYDINPEKFDEIMTSIGANKVGKAFMVYNYKNKIDLSLPRIESKIGNLHTDFTVKYTNDTLEAAKRRDFTINSIMKNIFTGEILDQFNGINDLNNKIIKHTSDKFSEDSLRVLRGIRFVSKLNFKISNETLELMNSLSLNNLSKERIVNELIKIFKNRYSMESLEYFEKLEIFQKVFNINVDFEKYIGYIENNDYRNYFYHLKHFTNENLEIVFKELKFPKEIFQIFRTFQLDNDLDIVYFSFKNRLAFKDFYGLNKDLMEKSKKLKVFYRPYNTKIKVKDIINEGFCGKDIGIELEKRIKSEILNLIKS